MAVRPLHNIKHSSEEKLNSDSGEKIQDVKSYLCLFYRNCGPRGAFWQEPTVVTMKSSDDSHKPDLKLRGVSHRAELIPIPQIPEKISRAAEIILPGGENPKL